eukprot:m.818643 g.818643  ORF g.818643 m.818643 type:complete len:87 (-) comp23394_c0_seq189:2898-3158(-)
MFTRHQGVTRRTEQDRCTSGALVTLWWLWMPSSGQPILRYARLSEEDTHVRILRWVRDGVCTPLAPGDTLTADMVSPTGETAEAQE